MKDQTTPDSTDRLGRLTSSKATFLRFLEKRVAQRADAEDILQSALVEVLAKPEALDDEERLFGWFYRILRNKITDHWRRAAAASRAHALAAARTPATQEFDTELYDATCMCVRGVIDTLKPEQAGLLRSVYVEGQSIAHAAQTLSTTKNNVGVKIHRARAALRDALAMVCRSCAAHGCLDCTCRKGRPL
jgi:RNA polymerase sigma factor (sigma-70 family)